MDFRFVGDNVIRIVDTPETRKAIQNKVNATADIVKSMDPKLLGGDSALFMYDKFNNFLFCFRQENKTKLELMANFVKFYKAVENEKEPPFNIIEVFKKVDKMEFVKNVYAI